MQNYLQSGFKRKKAALRVVFAFALALSMAAVVLWINGYNGIDGRGAGAAYVYKTGRVNAVQYDETALNNDGKMNKIEPENAKIYVLDPDFADSHVVLHQNVRVLTGAGEVVGMSLEEYVAGCVFGEMPLNFETQALMAQSIAVRSFTVRQMTMGTSKHKNADVCTNPACCQNYADTDEINPSVRQKLFDAVGVTKGMIMTYDGSPIEAVYHASSGEYTLSSEDVWGGRVEYLQSVKSPDGEQEIYENGYGHRVGMSQHGANLLAKQGKNYMEILKYYYKGITFDFLS